MVKNHIKVLCAFLEREALNIAALARAAKLDYKTAYLVVNDLEAQGLVHRTRFGQSWKLELTKRPHPLLFAAEYERRRELCKKKDFLVLTRRLAALPFPLIVLLFGSHAKGEATKHSDIDLCIVCEEQRENAVREELDLLPLPLHPTLLTFEHFTAGLTRKSFSVVSEAVKKNLVLVGIEDYYRLLEHAS